MSLKVVVRMPISSVDSTEQETEQHGDQQAHQQRLDDDEKELAVEGADGVAVVVNINDEGVVPAGDGDGDIHVAGGDVALVAHHVRTGGDAALGGQQVGGGLEAVEALLAVGTGQKCAGVPVQDVVVAGVGVQAQIPGLDLDHLLELFCAVLLGGLPAQGVDEGGVGGIGVAKYALHLLVKLVNVKAGDAGHHERAHYGHQGRNEQQHNEHQLHMQAAEHRDLPPLSAGGRHSFLCGQRKESKEKL